MAAAKVRPTISKRKGVSAGKLATAVRRVLAHKPKPKTPTEVAVPKTLRGIGAVVINLDSRPDRWEKVQCSLSKNVPWLSVKRLSATDGRTSPPSTREVTAKWSTARLAERFHWYLSKTIPMSPGERGCCSSHIEAWKLAAKGRKPLLVIEDDAVVMHSFSSSLSKAVEEAPKGTGAIWLSSKDRGYPKPAGEVLMQPSFVWTTVGYLIWPHAAKTLLEMLPVDMPVDNFMAYHIQQGAIKAFSMKPAGVRQAQTWNVGSDVPHSDDVAHR